MHPYILVSLGAGVAFILYKVVSNTLASRYYAAEAQRLGCKPPPKQENNWPFGVDRVRNLMRADVARIFPDFLVQRFKEMGVNTFEFSMLGTQGYLTADPKNIQAILATQFNDFCLGPNRRNAFMPLLGNGIFTQDGKPWEHSRAMIRPSFVREQVSDLELEEHHVQDMMRALIVKQDGWTAPVDLQVLFFRLTLDSATEFLFGESVGSQVANLPAEAQLNGAPKVTQDEKVFANAFDVGQRYLARRGRLLDKSWLDNTPGFRLACKQTHEFADHFVRLALHPELKEKEKDTEKGDRERYIFSEALASQTRDPIELRSQILNILLAGRDTTASLLGWTFYLLVRHPAIYDSLRATILAEFGTYAHPRDITFQSLKSCRQLQHTLNESLRLYSVVPVNSRVATKDTTIPVGGGPDGKSPIFVRKGQPVDYSVHVMHRRKDLWGPDADEFRPERWVGRKVGWEYLPFNGGPRICLGRMSSFSPIFPIHPPLQGLRSYGQNANHESRAIRPDGSIVRHGPTDPTVRPDGESRSGAEPET